MRLTMIFMIISLMQVSAASFAQKISIKKNKTGLLEILREVRSQTGYNFVITDDQVSKSRLVTLQVQNADLIKVLNQVFASQLLSYNIENNTIVVTDKIQAVRHNNPATGVTIAIVIKGKILDEKGEPLPGVIIKHKESGTATASNDKGEYKLSIPEASGTLVFSFIGYQKQEIPVGSQNEINLSLQPESGKLNEVVVVGYGTQAKSTVSNAITKVSAEDISASPAANLGAGLAGRMAGVTINSRGGEPGAEAVEVFIRGKSTTGDASPLYVIDGVVRDYSGLSYLNPNDIESISVLKDASAAIYGSRAANGVILITTKRGVSGKPTITLNYDHGLSQQMRVPETADAFTYASMANLEQRIKGQSEPYTAQDLELYRNGSDPLNHPNTDWAKLIFKNWSVQDRTDIGISGGSKDTHYFVSADYLSANSPFIQGSTYNKQYSVRSNLDFNVNDNLKVSVDLSGRKRDVQVSHLDYAHIYLGVPTQNAIYPNGLFGPGRTGNNAVVMARDPNYGYNNTQNGTFFGNVSADYKIPFLKGLSLQGTYAYDNDNSYIKSWVGLTYYYQLNKTTGEYEKKLNSNAATPTLGVSEPQSNSQTANIKLSYKNTFAEKHTVDAFIGYEQNSTQAYRLEAARTVFASSAIQELFAGTADKLYQSNYGSSARTGRENYFGRAQYSYMNRYNIQFQFRYDGSQNFPVDRRYGFFPGVSGNWNISKEKFMEGVSFVDNLKLRASYGEMGNDKVGAYQYLTSYIYDGNYVFNGTTNQGLVQSGAPNPNITWEVAKTTDIGLEFGVLKGLLSAEIDLFKTNRSNILDYRNASVPNYTGLTLPNENIGRVQNKGIEFTLTHAYKINEDLRYSVSGNLTYAKSTVVFRDEVPGIPDYQKGEGHPVGSQVLYEAIGVYNDAAEVAATPHRDGAGPGDLIIKDVNGDGIINSLDRVTQKYSPFPEIVYGLNFRFGYKAFDLLLGFQGQAHVVAPRFNPYPYDPVAWGNFPSYLAQDVWTPENPNGSKPKPGLTSALQTNGTTYHWENAAFLKLKTVELSYKLPQSLLAKAGIKGAKVYTSGSNLFFIKDHFKDLGIDPEVTNSGWGYSQNRVISFGASVTF